MEETIVLGRRRNRNRAIAQDDSNSGAEAVVESGSVKLVEDVLPSGFAESEPTPAQPAPENPPTGPASSAPGKPTPIKKTSSDVATAHAELDSVLPPGGTERAFEKRPENGSPPAAARRDGRSQRTGGDDGVTGDGRQYRGGGSGTDRAGNGRAVPRNRPGRRGRTAGGRSGQRRSVGIRQPAPAGDGRGQSEGRRRARPPPR